MAEGVVVPVVVEEGPELEMLEEEHGEALPDAGIESLLGGTPEQFNAGLQLSSRQIPSEP